MSKFRRRRKEEFLPTKGSVSFFEWAVGKDIFAITSDSWERTQKLLVEIQKRILAEQVLLVSWDTGKKNCRILAISPLGENSILDSRLLMSLIQMGFRVKRNLVWEDFWKDERIREQLKQSRCENVLLSPLSMTENHVDVLLIVNYSERGTPSFVSDFIIFISSVMVLTLQNSRLYMQLKKKNEELKDWTSHVEERIEEGTKKILEKEFQYYTLFEGANDGIIVLDESERLIEANKVACRLLGYDKKELLSMNWNQLAVTDSLPVQIEFFKKALKKEKVSPLRTALIKKDGSTFQAELSSRRVWFRGKKAVQTFVRDISFQMALEQSLRESKEKYRILVESSLVGVFIIRKGIIQFVNSTFEEITGYTKEELLGKNLFNLITPEDRSKVTSYETRREDRKEAPDHYEVRFLMKGGDRRWCDVHSCHILVDGRDAVLGNVIDITKRKQLEMHLSETQKMESIGTLAGGIAHDFNNLLGGILGYASLLLSDMSKDHPFYDDIHSIAETAKRAADLTNRLLAFARGGKYQVTSIALNKIVEDLVVILSRTVDRAVVIKTSLDKDLWPVKGDSQQIHQAILNICLNARDAMPEGGELTIETANVSMDESPTQVELGIVPGAYVRITVTDTGAGMNEKMKSRMFEPFFTTKQAGEGTGLGLSMVYGVIKNHDGSIFVDSELGKGTKVTILLPRFIDEEKVVIKPSKRKTELNYRVLLVDDEEVIRQVGRRMLEKGGFEVLVARNGMEAVNIFNKNKGKVDLVIIDLVMPKMGGKETFRRLQEIDPGVRVVFASGYGPYDRPEITLLGNEFIQKPFQTEILIQTVRTMLGISE